MRATDITIRWVAGPEDMRGALGLREQVFCREQGVSRAEEVDGLDGDALHLIALEVQTGRIVGTLRLLTSESEAKIGRVAVERDRRRQGIASRMLDAGILEARERGFRKVRLTSQLDATQLYERFGFTIESGQFEEAGIPHVWMGMALDPDDYSPEASSAA